jgi:hypothetical protein
VDAPEIVAALTELLAGVRIYTKAELDVPFAPAACSKIELREIKAYQLESLGDVLFHYMD